MNYRSFGNTELNVSEVGFGAWAIGGPAMAGTIPIGWGPADTTQSLKALKEAADRGINFFDTADFYGLGRSEELIGKAFSNDPSIMVASKVGHRLSKNKNIIVDYSEQYILRACEGSLRRLKRECIDYYQLHTAKVSDLKDGGCVKAMEALKKKGLIRYWGVSLNTFLPEPEAEYIFNNHLGSGLQVVLNTLNQKAVPIIEKAGRLGYGIIARMPFQFGLLTGKYTVNSSFEENDHRSFRLKKSILLRILPELDPFFEMSRAYGVPPATLALSFILNIPGVSTVIPGIKNTEQARANTPDMCSITEKDLKVLKKLYIRKFDTLLEFLENEEKPNS